MRLQSVAGLWAVATVFAASCGGSDERPPPPTQAGSGGLDGGSGGEGTSGGSAGIGGTGTGGAEGGAAGAGGTGAAGGASGGVAGTGQDPDAGAGSGGVFSGSLCGDGLVTRLEQCDGTAFADFTCVDFGYETGTLACLDDCTIDPSGCSGTERCADGRDNDGDSDTDCLDVDCDPACGDPCSVPDPITLPATYSSTTFGHVSSVDVSCGSASGAPDVVYPVVAEVTGVLEAILLTSRDLNISIHGACGTAASELGCDRLILNVPVVAGQSYFVVVDGDQADDIGTFDIEISNRTPDCGDLHTDAAEACDDGNVLSGDGCSASCTLENSEGADNDLFGSADAYDAPYVGTISAGDVDFVSVVVPNDNSGIFARTRDFGDQSCEIGVIDSYLQILDTDGTTELAWNDDTDASFCAETGVSASLGAANLDAGTYYVRVSAPLIVPGATFTYVLDVSVDRCGDDFRGESENCDDGNNIAGDLCAPDCTLEPLP